MIHSFQEAMKESKRKCGDKLEEIRALIVETNQCFPKLEKIKLAKSKNSLVFWSHMNAIRNSGYVLYLTYCGLYRNAFENIRHIIESIVQGVYVDLEHDKSSLITKLEIMKEIQDQKEYHVTRLIKDKIDFGKLQCKGLDCKGLLINEYKELSNIVHPSHLEVIDVMKNILEETKDLPTMIDCEQVARIFEAMKRTYDLFFFLIVATFPECKQHLIESGLAPIAEKYDLKLLKKIIESLEDSTA